MPNLIVIILLSIIAFLIYWHRPCGVCERCNNSLSIANAKRLGNQIVCKKCYVSNRDYPISIPSNNPLTPQEAEKIKNAKKILWIKYFWSDNKTFEEKVNIVKIAPESITGYSHGWKKIQRFYYERIINWKMLDEYVPGKEPYNKMEGVKLYDTYAENAIKTKQCMWIKYEDDNGKSSERIIDIYYSKYGYLLCWCHLRKKPRSFKIDNVKQWKILNEAYNRDPKIESYLKNELDHFQPQDEVIY